MKPTCSLCIAYPFVRNPNAKDRVVPPIVYHALLMSTTNPLPLDSAVIPVTGAASGLGLAIAKRLHAAGALPLLLDIDERRLEAARHEVFGDASPVAGAAPCTYVLDVRDSAAVDACFDTLRAHHGPVTHAVANAGVGGATNALQMTDAHWHAVMDVNLHGTMYFCRAAARQLVERGQGAIVTIGSIAGLMVKPDRVAYTSSKAAVIQMTRALALDLGPLGVRVNGVAPGVIDTDMLRSCFGGTASRYPAPAKWVEKAVPLILSLNSRDNGKQVTIRS